MRLHLNLYSEDSQNSITRYVEINENSTSEIVGDIVMDMIDTLNSYSKKQEVKIEAQRLTQQTD